MASLRWHVATYNALSTRSLGRWDDISDICSKVHAVGLQATRDRHDLQVHARLLKHHHVSLGPHSQVLLTDAQVLPRHVPKTDSDALGSEKRGPFQLRWGVLVPSDLSPECLASPSLLPTLQLMI